MKSLYKKQSLLLLAAILSLGFLLPHTTHASLVADMALLIPGYIVSLIVMPLMSFLVYMAGMLLNLSIDMSVVNMADNISSAGIDGIWQIMRDVANMGFIFVLVYTAIMTIFGKGDYQKVIKNTIIAALLINFSLFITKAVIDASNLIALFFYNAISPGGITLTKGISAGFMDVLGIANLYKGTDAFEGTRLVIIGLGGAVIYLITAFSFLAVAFLFIIRFVILLLIMVLSPLMFIASIIPYLKDKADMWWNVLMSQSLFGPIYFMLTWVTLKIAQAMFRMDAGNLSSTGTTSFGGVLGGIGKGGMYMADPGAAALILKFIIIIAFMIASLLAAKSMAEKTGGGITKMALGWAGGATLGLAGRAGRGTIGRAGAGLANSQKMKDWEVAGGVKAMSSRLALLAGNKAAKSSFDIRATKAGAKLDAGKVKKGTSFEQDVKDRTKTANERVKFVGLDKKAKDLKKEEDKAEKEAKEQLANLEKEAKKESEKVHPDIKKSAELEFAEERERDARSAASRISISPTAKPEEIAEAKKVHDEARVEADKLREEHKKAEQELEEKRKAYIESKTAAQRDALKTLETNRKAPDAQKKSDEFIERQGQPFIGKRGLGAITADKMKASGSTPISWLGRKLGPVLELRQKEGDDRVKAIRKEFNKSEEDKQKEEIIKAAKEAAKEGAKEGAKKDEDK